MEVHADGRTCSKSNSKSSALCPLSILPASRVQGDLWPKLDIETPSSHKLFIKCLLCGRHFADRK